MPGYEFPNDGSAKQTESHEAADASTMGFTEAFRRLYGVDPTFKEQFNGTDWIGTPLGRGAACLRDSNFLSEHPFNGAPYENAQLALGLYEITGLFPPELYQG
ncbi:MAG TPA: hypothetical protein VJP80_06865 [Candidatus Saccharimonadales bacterium]|nr:hypothetical protein [Candidatus Saccharimonadales bacterium]